jgi:hypothetical protein
MKKSNLSPSKTKISFSILILLFILFAAGSASAQGNPPTIQGPMLKVVAGPASPTPSYFPRCINPGHAPQSATITVDYKLGNLVGCATTVDSWDDTPPGDTSTLKQAFERAVATWEATLDSPIEIRVEATLENIGGSTLGYMGPRATANWGSQPVNDVWFPFALADKISGSDLAPGNYDIIGKMTCREDWNTDDASTDGDGYSGEYDFESVALHELGHGLGFVGGATYDSGTGKGGVRDDTYKFPWVYTCFTGSTNPHGRYLLNTTEFPEDSVAMGNVLINKGGTSNNGEPGIYFYGNDAVLANNGPIKLYTPNTWSSGSSYSHLDSNEFNGTAEDLMTPSIGPADITRAVGPVTKGMFDDFGWSGGTFNAEACASPTPNTVIVQDMVTTYSWSYLKTRDNNILLIALAGIMVLALGGMGVFLHRRA